MEIVSYKHACPVTSFFTFVFSCGAFTSLVTFGALCLREVLFLEAAAPRDDPKSILRDISPKMQLSSNNFGVNCNYMHHCLSSAFKSLCNIACYPTRPSFIPPYFSNTVAITTQPASFSVSILQLFRSAYGVRIQIEEWNWKLGTITDHHQPDEAVV